MKKNIGSAAATAKIHKIIGMNSNEHLLEIFPLLERRDGFENELLSVRHRSTDKLEMKNDIAFIGFSISYTVYGKRFPMFLLTICGLGFILNKGFILTKASF